VVRVERAWRTKVNARGCSQTLIAAGCLSPRACHGERHVNGKGGLGIPSAAEPADWNPCGRWSFQEVNGIRCLFPKISNGALLVPCGTPRAHSFSALSSSWARLTASKSGASLGSTLGPGPCADTPLHSLLPPTAAPNPTLHVDHAFSLRSHSSPPFATNEHQSIRLGFLCQCCVCLECGLLKPMPSTITIQHVALLTTPSPYLRLLCDPGILLVMSSIFVTGDTRRKTLHGCSDASDQITSPFG
jgi:hypothetical protein